MGADDLSRPTGVRLAALQVLTPYFEEGTLPSFNDPHGGAGSVVSSLCPIPERAAAPRRCRQRSRASSGANWPGWRGPTPIPK